MAERYSALVTGVDGLLRNICGTSKTLVRHFIRKICMYVDMGIVLLRHVEDHIDMSAGVVRGELDIGAATHNVRSHAHGCFHEIVGPVRFKDAFLRKSNDLEIEKMFVFLSELEQCFYSDQSLDQVDIRMRTDRNRTILHRHIEDPAGAVQHISALLLTLEDAGHPDGLIQGPKHCRQTAMQHCLVEMKVRLNQPWNDRPAASVDTFYRRCPNAFFNSSDLAVFDANVHEWLIIPHPNIVNQQVHFHH